MVALLHILSAAALFASHVVANPAPANAIHELLARQVSPFDASKLPEKCKSSCSAATNGLAGCTSISCICQDSTLSNVGKCLSCGVSIQGSGLNVQSAQQIIDQMADACEAAGSPVKGFTISANAKDSGAARSGALSAGAIAVAAFGAILAAA